MIVYNLTALYSHSQSIVRDSTLSPTVGKDCPKSLNPHSFNLLLNSTDLNAKLTGKTESVHAAQVLQEFEGIKELSLDALAEAKVPNTVYYLWCPNHTLEFRQYLGILSIWKIMRPDIIEFHHQFPLKPDKYNNWLEELQKQIPGFVLKPFSSNNRECKESMTAVWTAIAYLHDKGGIYVAPDVIVTEEILKLKRQNFSVIFSKKNSTVKPEVAIIMGNSRDESIMNFFRTYDKNKETGNEIVCSNIDKDLSFTNVGKCYRIDINVHPDDVWTLENDFGNLARKLVYGNSNVKSARPILPGKIPKIVHYVWFGSKEMDFVMYLSMLSTLFIANAETVYVHGDGRLFGKYFEKIKQDKRLRLINHHQPLHIFGHSIRNLQHMSDIIRAEVLLKYGGIYVDWDVIWLLDPEEIINQGYDTVANYDHMEKPGFPNTINLGVFMAKPRSTFVKKWQDALSNYRSDDFQYNAVLLPYKVYEKYPEYLHIEKRLQVMCYFLKCHPVFHPEFKLFGRDQPFNWNTDVYAIHFTYPNPPEWESEETLRNGSGRFAQIGKYVLQHQDRLTKQPNDQQ